MVGALASKGLFLQQRLFLSTKSSAAANKPLRVGVVGAGVAGLQAARALALRGHDVVVYEAADSIGGVWRENYVGSGVQVPRRLYEFPEHPWTTVSHDAYPTTAQVKEYVQSYVDQKLPKNVSFRFNCRVNKAEAEKPNHTGVLYDPSSKWNLTLSNNTSEKVDYLVWSTGGYSRPFVPSHLEKSAEEVKEDGPKVLHSSRVTDYKLLKGKDVVVIGSCKSALDLAVEASAVAKSTTLVRRHVHWATPRKIAELIPFEYVFLSRFGQTLVSLFKGRWPTRVTHRPWPLTALLMRPVFGIVELLFAYQLAIPLNGPPHDVVADLYGYATILDHSFQNAVKDGKIKVIEMTEITKVQPDGTAALFTPTTGASSIPADLVIAATGFKKSYEVFDEQTQAALNPESDGLYLYRHMLSPKIANLAFVGSEVATISNITTHALQAEYLSRALSGEFELPTQAAMEAEVEKTKKWKREWMPETSCRASLVLLHQIDYNDSLIQAFGGSPSRKKNLLEEYLMPIRPLDYANVVGKR